MRCRVGDLAVIVGAHPDYRRFIGRFVTLVRWHSDGWDWETDLLDPGFGIVHVADRHLRPIRPDDGADETLTWAGKPQEVTA